MLEKSPTIKKIFLLGIELKKPAGITEKQYREFDKVYEFEKEGAETINDNDKKPSLEKYSKLDLIHDVNHSFFKYFNIRKIDNLFIKSKYSFLANFLII